jgi:hypothetical protein
MRKKNEAVEIAAAPISGREAANGQHEAELHASDPDDDLTKLRTRE